MIKAVIFDLDSCLAAADELGKEVFSHALDAIRRANHGHLSEAALEKAFVDVWRLPIDAVAERHGFSKEMRDAAWRGFSNTTIDRPMHGYGDLDALPDLQVRLFLVTSGFRRLQDSKINALGIRKWFEAIYIDAIDEPHRTGKQGHFQTILQNSNLSPGEVLVVGDNPESEIAAGIRLGMTTVQTLRPGVPRGDNAAYHIHSLHELKALLET
jgi:putative hydrolase of the HAD superfamily